MEIEKIKEYVLNSRVNIESIHQSLISLIDYRNKVSLELKSQSNKSFEAFKLMNYINGQIAAILKLPNVEDVSKHSAELFPVQFIQQENEMMLHKLSIESIERHYNKLMLMSD